jgi:hypothetical protein
LHDKSASQKQGSQDWMTKQLIGDSGWQQRQVFGAQFSRANSIQTFAYDPRSKPLGTFPIKAAV